MNEMFIPITVIQTCKSIAGAIGGDVITSAKPCATVKASWLTLSITGNVCFCDDKDYCNAGFDLYSMGEEINLHTINTHL